MFATVPTRSAPPAVGVRWTVPVVAVGVRGRAERDLEACRALLGQLPRDLGCAVVVAGSDGCAAGLGDRSSLRVVPAEDGLSLAPEHVYVVPPDAVATIRGDAVRVVARAHAAAPDRPIDHLFRSVAVARRERALGVLVSRGGDGALGAREIRQAGGILLATAADDDPVDRTGADLVLDPAEVASRLAELAARGNPRTITAGSEADVERLTGLFGLLRTATGADLSRIRISRILARVRRRMALAGEGDLGAYVARLARDPEELGALHLDVLRRPASFFREPEVFAWLLDAFAARTGRSEPVRVWVAGCGTGEEAYSIAMTLLECRAHRGGSAPIRILATDDDDRLIDHARAGTYSNGIALDVSPERLRRFFVRTHDGQHQVHPSVRELCTFGRHDLVDDPPFSRLDLVWCPDALGQLDPVSVARVLPRFHAGLEPGGHGVFGREAAAVEASRLFAPVGGVEGVYAPQVVASRAPDGAPAPTAAPSLRAAASALLGEEADRALLRRYSPPCIAVDERGDVLLARGALGPYVSVDADEALPNLERSVHPDLLPELRRLLGLARATGGAVRGVPTRVRRAHASNLVELDVLPLHEAGQRCWLVTFEEVVGHRLAVGDELVTSREADQHADAELAALEEELDGIFGSAGLAFVTVDAGLRVRRARPRAAPPFQVGDDAIARPLRDLRHGLELPDLEERARRVITSGVGRDEVVLDREGHRCTLSIRPLRGTGRVLGVVLLAVPVIATEADRAELAREQHARREAEAANHAKDEFLAMLAHELRNPLAPLQSAVQLLQRQDAGSGAAALTMALRQVRHLARLVDDLLDAARLTRDKVVLRLELVELVELLRRVIDLHRPAFAHARLPLTVHLPEDPVWLLADPTRIEQVVTNVLQNAIKYSPAGRAVTVHAREEGAEIRVAVRDEGVGMDRHLLARVFDLFVQGRESRDRSAGGLGIGLTIVKRLVELHGGTVSAHSDGPGQGSEFELRLPTHAPPSRDQAPGDLGALPEATPRRVLVVDDNRDAADTLTVLLRSAGHDVRAVYDGVGALAAVDATLPDVVLLDIGLPGMNGFEVAVELRRRLGPRVPRLVALTGYGDARDRERSHAVGFHHHLVKPIEPLAMERLLLDPTSGAE